LVLIRKEYASGAHSLQYLYRKPARLIQAKDISAQVFQKHAAHHQQQQRRQWHFPEM
jgi:hypothetical protein